MRYHRHLVHTIFAWLLGMLAFSGCAPLSLRPSDDLEPYKAAMLPQAHAQLDQVRNAPRYDISLYVDDDQLTVNGQQTVRYANNQNQELNEIYFRLYPNLDVYGGNLQVSRTEVNGREVQASYEAERTALRVPLPFNLRPSQSVRIGLDFLLSVKHREQEPVLMGENQGILSLPNFYPQLAVCQHGSWDLSSGPEFADAVFSDIALYRVEIDVPHGMVVISSGSVVSETDTAEGRRVIRSVSGPARDFGLIMSPLFVRQSLSVRGIAVSSYHLPQDAPAGYSVLWRATAALQVYSDVFSDYPYAKFDVVEAPLGKHGQEYPALILIGSDVYRTDKDKIEPLVVHETAHQWWYNLVGSDPINEPAVDEGLAEFSLFYYYAGVYGPRYAEKIVQTRWTEPYEYAKEHGLDAAVEQPASAFTRDNYESIIYAKSGTLYHELRQYMGPAAFDEAIRNYLNSYRYRIAPAGAFLGIASGNTPLGLEKYAAKWREAVPSEKQEQSE